MKIGAIRTVTLCFGLILLTISAAVYGSKHDLSRSRASHLSYCNAYDSDNVRCGCFNDSSSFDHYNVCCKTQDEFLRSAIVPDFTPCVPCCEIKVEYSNGEKMHLGNTVSSDGADKQPSVQYTASYHRNFTIILLGLDGLTNAKRGQAGVLFLVMGVRGSDINQGDTVVKYATFNGVSNPQGLITTRRTVYLLYEEGPMATHVTALERAELANPEGLISPIDFAAEHNLGNPVCVNFAWRNKRLYSNQ